jgi:hypothetical protein
MAQILLLELDTPLVTFILDERTGNYNAVSKQNGNTATDQVGLMDILFLLTKTIKKIKSKTGQLIEINNKIEINGSNPLVTHIISNFSYQKNRLYINGNIDVDTVRLYVEPVKTEEVKNKLDKLEDPFFDKIQAKIESSREQLWLGKSFSHNKTETLENFVINFIKNYNNNYVTKYIKSGGTQTIASKRRSLGDMFLIVKYYYPVITLRELVSILHTKVSQKGIASIICATINKRVWWNYGSSRMDKGTDEFGYSVNDWRNELAKVPIKVETKPLIKKESYTIDEIKEIYTVGTKFKSIVTTGKQYKIDGKEFYDGMRTIVAIGKDGSRKVVYDKNTNILATIIK